MIRERTGGSMSDFLKIMWLIGIGLQIIAYILVNHTR